MKWLTVFKFFNTTTKKKPQPKTKQNKQKDNDILVYKAIQKYIQLVYTCS